jgi:hypothetical protein
MKNRILFGFYHLAKNREGEGVSGAPGTALFVWLETAESATCAA